MWSRKVFVSLLRRYDLMPYRYRGQRYTTVMVKSPKSFVDETLWPEFQKISSELDTYLQEVTDRVVKEVLHEDSSDVIIVDQPLQIGSEQSSALKNPINARDEKSGMLSDMKDTGHARKKRKAVKEKKSNSCVQSKCEGGIFK